MGRNEGENVVSNYVWSFFDASEQETGALVGFVSDNVDQTILNQGHFQIGEQSYSIIGMGWVIPWSFAAAKSALSTMDVFGEAYGEETRFYIIPFPDIRKNIDQDRFWLSFIMRHIKI